jgi:hypothetical protein
MLAQGLSEGENEMKRLTRVGHYLANQLPASSKVKAGRLQKNQP